MSTTVSNTNENIYLAILDANAPLTRDEVMARTGYARTTAYDALARIELKGWVEKFKIKLGERGRPRAVWGVNTQNNV